MGSKTCSSLFLTLNVLFFAVVSAHGPCPGPNPNPNPKPKPRPTSLSGGSNTLEASSCPRDELKLGICTNLLNRTVNITLGEPPVIPCCSLIAGLVDFEAAVCLCTALKANVLGINLNVTVNLSLLLNYCGKGVPKGFVCY